MDRTVSTLEKDSIFRQREDVLLVCFEGKAFTADAKNSFRKSKKCFCGCPIIKLPIASHLKIA
ncbi:MAG: hypothetical protein HFG24_08230 [Anaerotruncus sp.]|nr:hypothetical protein [Anaerotruncus sp.]MCI9235955.1 hypothetical protein [Anaerotruncus sp.]